MLGRISLSLRLAFRRLGTIIRTAEARALGEIGKSVFSAESQILSKRERSAIRVGDHCHIRGDLMVFRHGGRIKIGDWVYIGPGSSIWSSSNEGVTVGNRVLISTNVHIHDTNGHPLDAAERFQQTQAILTYGHPVDIKTIAAAPIRICDDAWIGFNAAILKGVTIGKGAIVGASSVVTHDVPPYAVVVGNPARVVKKLRDQEL